MGSDYAGWMFIGKNHLIMSYQTSSPGYRSACEHISKKQIRKKGKLSKDLSLAFLLAFLPAFFSETS